MAVINSYRSFNRMKSANNRVEHQDILTTKSSKPQLGQRSVDSFATQSDISIRGFSPLPAEVKRPKTADLYSKAAIKPADIEQYNKASSEALEERTKSRQDPEDSGLFQRTGTLIRLGSSLSKKSPHDGGDDDDVVIIHDAKVALPNPVLHESIDPSQNASNNNTKVVGRITRSAPWATSRTAAAFCGSEKVAT